MLDEAKFQGLERVARVGAKLWPPHRFPTDAFKPGKNEIQIRVGNLVNNNYNKPTPSGLLGPVVVEKLD